MKNTITNTALCAGFAILAAGAALAAQPGGLRGADADGDGLITAEEIDARTARLFDEADADGDGALSADELSAYREERRRQWREENDPDRNKDGVISFAEHQDAAKARFERLDENGDGVLDEDERRRHHGRRGHGRGRQ